MLFSEPVFFFVFLPGVLGLFLIASKYSGAAVAKLVIIAASLVFYAYWHPPFLLLLLASIGLNFLFGRYLARLAGHRLSKFLLAGGVVANLLALAYFKYAGFLVTGFNQLSDSGFVIPNFVLPIGISFFTFQQIAYLVDVHRRPAKPYRLIDYTLFVSFFPQLIAGPIVHHREMMPQFRSDFSGGNIVRQLSMGLTVFAVGLFKKVILADGIAQYADLAFNNAAELVTLDFLTAWQGALAYSFQIYFDFSGYSDMAIGLAFMFGIRLPINFSAPYRATNIIDFWRSWHMTLSRFLREYLYIALGGNRRGAGRRYLNLTMTMLLGGLWHGASWNFVLWGGLHGFYLIINHLWRRLVQTFYRPTASDSSFGKAVGAFITFLAVTVAWVFFRAETFDVAWRFLEAMSGLNGLAVPVAVLRPFGGTALAGKFGIDVLAQGGSHFVFGWLFVAAAAAIVLTLPTTSDWLGRDDPALPGDPKFAARPLPALFNFRWRPSRRWGILVGLMLIAGIWSMSGDSPFLYYRF